MIWLAFSFAVLVERIEGWVIKDKYDWMEVVMSNEEGGEW
jgi:hypothetical protein